MGINLKRWVFGLAVAGLLAVHGSQAQTSTDTTTTAASTDPASFDPFAGTTTDTSGDTTIVTNTVRPPYVPPARTPYVPPPK